MSRFNPILTVMVLWVMLFLGGCTTYRTFEGELPRDQYAIIVHHDANACNGFLEVNGKVLSNGFNLFSSPRTYSKIKVEEGFHRLVAEQDWSHGESERVAIGVYLEGGHTYKYASYQEVRHTTEWSLPLWAPWNASNTASNTHDAHLNWMLFSRPNDGYVWIYDVDTKEVVWGVAPHHWLDRNRARPASTFVKVPLPADSGRRSRHQVAPIRLEASVFHGSLCARRQGTG